MSNGCKKKLVSIHQVNKETNKLHHQSTTQVVIGYDDKSRRVAIW